MTVSLPAHTLTNNLRHSPKGRTNRVSKRHICPCMCYSPKVCGRLSYDLRDQDPYSQPQDAHLTTAADNISWSICCFDNDWKQQKKAHGSVLIFLQLWLQKDMLLKHFRSAGCTSIAALFVLGFSFCPVKLFCQRALKCGKNVTY